jgi:hypothetical protein
MTHKEQHREEPANNDASHGSGHYEICVHGRLDARWAAWFDGLAVAPGDVGMTTIRGHIADQAALHGVLAKIRDLGVPIVSIKRLSKVEEVTNP